MKSYVFKVLVEEDETEDGEKAYHAFCPALKGCHTWGHTYDEALANAREAIELYLEDLRESGRSVPVDPAQGALEWPTAAVAVNYACNETSFLKVIEQGRESARRGDLLEHDEVVERIEKMLRS